MYGESGSKCSYEVFELPNVFYGEKISIAEGSGYENEDETFKAMSDLIGVGEWVRTD